MFCRIARPRFFKPLKCLGVRVQPRLNQLGNLGETWVRTLRVTFFIMAFTTGFLAQKQIIHCNRNLGINLLLH
ncbi:MAG: hypothetical protein EBT92_02240 [Planctomycetes bacterium]|nr:hypothetical protein [Planctomycetota bacterium]